VEGGAGRLEDGLVGHAVRGGAARGGEGVDDEVDLAAGHLGLDRFDDLGLELGREGVAIDRDGLEAGLLRFGVEARGVIPTGGAGLVAFAVAFEEHAERGGAGAEGGGDAGGKAVARGGADHQDRLRSALDGLAGLDVGDLLADRRGAAVGVGGDADEPADTGLQDLLGHVLTLEGGETDFNP